MDESSERYVISGRKLRTLRLAVGCCFLAHTAIGCVLTVALLCAGAVPIRNALFVGAIIALEATIAAGVMIPAIFARRLIASPEGLELERDGVAIHVPWRNVSACRKLTTDLVFFRPAYSFDVYVDGRFERVFFLPEKADLQTIDYLRHPELFCEDDEELEDEEPQPRGVIITC